MANKSIVSNDLLNEIARAIAAADGGSNTMQIAEMPARIEMIAEGGSSGGGGDFTFDPFSVPQGSYYTWRLPASAFAENRKRITVSIDVSTQFSPTAVMIAMNSSREIFVIIPDDWSSPSSVNVYGPWSSSNIDETISNILDASAKWSATRDNIQMADAEALVNLAAGDYPINVETIKQYYFLIIDTEYFKVSNVYAD